MGNSKSFRRDALFALLFGCSFLKNLPSVLAQCSQTTCEACLGEFNCVWNVNGNCQEGCGGFPNVECYFARTFGEGSTIPQICTAAADKVEENEVCFGLTTAESCLQQAGCSWITGRIENGLERSWCALDVDYKPPAIPCSDDTCNACLSDDTCVWNKGDTCSNSCDNFPNIECYYARMFGATSSQNAAICSVANSSIVENEACFNETDQSSCFDVSGCSWVSTDPSNAEVSGHCTFSLAAVDDGGSSGAQSRFDWRLLLASLSGVFLVL